MLIRFIKYRLLKIKRKNQPYVLSDPPYSNCKNCGFELHGKFCSVCGQFAHMNNRPFTDSIKFYLEHHYALDHKLGHTLKYLLFRPGFLTREFMNGRIERYVHPFKLYLFSSILLFGIVVSLSKHESKEDNKPIIEASTLKQNVDKHIKQLQDSMKVYGKELPKEQLAKISSRIDSLKHVSTNELSISGTSGGESTLGKSILKGLTNTSKKELEHRFFHYLSLSMLLLMPLFGGLLMGLYHSRERFYTAHLVHSLHLHVMLFISISLASIWSYFVPTYSLLGWLLLAWLIYYVLSLSRFYGESKRKSFMKGCLLLGLYLIIASIVVVSVLFAALVEG